MLYDYQCPRCGWQWEVTKPLAEIDRVEPCPSCEAPGERLIRAPRVLGDYAGYSCPITGAWIEGRKAHRENLAKHGCRLLEPGEKEEGLRRRRKEEADLDNAVAETVAEEIHKMPVVKRDHLAAELQGGLGIEITRGSSPTP